MILVLWIPYISIVTNNSLQWGSLDAKPTWTPMSPQTKNRVNYARRTQLVLRVFALFGALGSLFCSIVINNVATITIWIIRAGVSNTTQTRLDLTANCLLAHCCNPSFSLCHLPPLSLPSQPASRFTSELWPIRLHFGCGAYPILCVYRLHGSWRVHQRCLPMGHSI